MPVLRRPREMFPVMDVAPWVGTATGKVSKPTPKLNAFLRNVAVGVVRHLVVATMLTMAQKAM
jgi:hypothetical protein